MSSPELEKLHLYRYCEDTLPLGLPEHLSRNVFDTPRILVVGENVLNTAMQYGYGDELPERLSTLHEKLRDTNISFRPYTVRTEPSRDSMSANFLTELIPDNNTTAQLMVLEAILSQTFEGVPYGGFRIQYVARVAFSTRSVAKEIESALKRTIAERKIDLYYGAPEPRRAKRQQNTRDELMGGLNLGNLLSRERKT